MTKIPFYIPQIGKNDVDSVRDVLRSGWLTTGPKTIEFEKAFSTYIGCKHAIAVNSCTAALHLALDAIGLKEEDEVLIPTMTFTSTGEVVTYFRAKPVLVDCEENGLLIDISKMEDKITNKTRCIIPVHFAGQPCNMDEINKVASKYNLKVVEDAAHSLPAKFRQKLIGTIGDITCFSFYATKTITTGEGGMACTENDEFAKKMKMMSLHGINRDAWKRYGAEGTWYYEVSEAGFKYNMTDIAAALGLSQLEKCDRFYQKRKKIADIYSRALKNIPEIETPIVKEYGTHAWHLYVIQLNLQMLKIDRGQFFEKMREHGIGCSVHFIPLHLHPFYKRTYGYKSVDFPIATAAYNRILSLPIYPKLSDNEVFYVIDTVKRIINENKK